RLYLIDPEPSDQVPFIRSYDIGILIDPADLKSGVPLTFNFVDWAQDNFGLNRVYVELRTITEAYYKYQSSLARQVIVRQDPFAEPVFIYNNIDGGYGNFSGFSSSISSFDVSH
ncbi:MAG TPA: DUF4249 family protein, partial [Saprospiraceae bacterium]|nr:DUF4249 family protein [Saprospiraceae bacterium]